MFTGLVEEVATVRKLVHHQMSVSIELAAQAVMDAIRLGDSIAVNGVCLTVTRYSTDGFAADAVPETMRRTNLGRLRVGSTVNLERALRVGDRLGGHIVSGHVDGTGLLTHRTPEGLATVLTIRTEPGILRYVAEKGSICVDGVSLTVMDVQSDSFRVSIIPHTSTHTTLVSLPVGSTVNLECDVLAKYTERLLNFTQSGQGHHEGAGLSLDFLRKNGYA